MAWLLAIQTYSTHKLLGPEEGALSPKVPVPAPREDLICPVWAMCSFWTNPWGQRNGVLPTVRMDPTPTHCALRTGRIDAIQTLKNASCTKVRCTGWSKAIQPPMAVSELVPLRRSWRPSYYNTVHTPSQIPVDGDRRQRLPVLSGIYVLTGRVHQRSGQSTKPESSWGWLFNPAEISNSC